MKNEKRIKPISLIAIIISILGLTIAFAAMSRTLILYGDVKVGKFDVHFERDNNFTGHDHIYEFINTDGIEDQTSSNVIMSQDKTIIRGISAYFNKTGIAARYKFLIKNDSNVTAYVEKIIYTDSCNLSNSIKCKLVDFDSGSEIDGDVSLSPNEEKYVELQVTVPDEIGSYIEENNYIIGLQILFNQEPVNSGNH